MFLNYNTHQLILPLDFSVQLQENDLAFVIDHFLSTLPESVFQPFYQRYGRPSYSPKMMLAVFLCAYCQGIYSGRKIEGLLHDSLRMMWLAQGESPNFRTLNRFRVNPLMAALLQETFLQFRTQLLENKMIDGKALYIDGTKIEADANKFTFVWKKSMDRFETKLNENALALYKELVTKEILPELIEEMKDELSLDEIESIYQALLAGHDQLSQALEQCSDKVEKRIIRHQRSVLYQSKKKFLDFKSRKRKYKEAKRVLGNRNSYSKTDTDATFMRMKEDYMKNGHLKAGYNVQVGTESQFALTYHLFPNPTDTRTLIPFIENHRQVFEPLEMIVADAGYGSEENYEFVLENLEKLPLISYGTFIKEEKRKFKKNLYVKENWTYLEREDVYLCSQGQRLAFRNYSQRKDKYGFIRNFKVYESEDCSHCPVKSLCTKAKGNRRLQVNPTWENFKAHVKDLLKTNPETHAIYRQRKIDVEPTFGDLKRNLSFTRFHVRGQEKVSNEMGLVFMAHNIRKWIKRVDKREEISMENPHKA